MDTSEGSPTGLTFMEFVVNEPVKVPDVPVGELPSYAGFVDEADDHVTSKLLSYWGIVKVVV